MTTSIKEHLLSPFNALLKTEEGVPHILRLSLEARISIIVMSIVCGLLGGGLLGGVVFYSLSYFCKEKMVERYRNEKLVEAKKVSSNNPKTLIPPQSHYLEDNWTYTFISFEGKTHILWRTPDGEENSEIYELKQKQGIKSSGLERLSELREKGYDFVPIQ